MKNLESTDSRLPHSMYGDDPRFGLERFIEDIPGYAEGEPVTIIGPADGNFEHCGAPLIRPAEISDFRHRCRVCRSMRKRVKSGELILVADFSQSPETDL